MVLQRGSINLQMMMGPHRSSAGGLPPSARAATRSTHRAPPHHSADRLRTVVGTGQGRFRGGRRSHALCRPQ